MTINQPPLDEARVEEFAGRLLSGYTESMVNLMIDVGFRTGLLDTLAAGEGASAELAERAGLVERYVRECLGALVTAGSSTTTRRPAATLCRRSTQRASAARAR